MKHVSKPIALLALAVFAGAAKPPIPVSTPPLSLDGTITVSIENQTGYAITLSGFPFDEATCVANFRFDDYDGLTTPEFFKGLPPRSTTVANVQFSGCADPEAFKANYGVQLTKGDADMGHLSVSCFFDLETCQATTDCVPENSGFACQVTGGPTTYRFVISDLSATEVDLH